MLEGDFSFVQRLADRGIKRVQVNATRANGVDVSLYGVEGLWKCIQSVPEVEWIIQRNEETRKLWEPIVHTLDSYGGHLDKTNVTISNDVYGHNAQEFPPPSSTLKPKGIDLFIY